MEAQCLVLILLVTATPGEAVAGKFLGGSMSFEVSDAGDDSMVTFHILTGWVLGTGPCGPTCGENDVGKDTSVSRAAILSQDIDAFGNWNKEIQGSSQLKENITDYVNSHMKEKLLSLNIKSKWELEMIDVNITTPSNVSYTDFIFEGNKWQVLTLQPNVTSYHMQAKVLNQKRSDTKMPNQSPTVMFMPLYRLGKNKSYSLKISSIDKDGDFITCARAEYIQSIELYNAGKLPHTSINKDCTVDINTTYPAYDVGDTAAFSIVVSDKPTKNVEILQSSTLDIRKSYITEMSSIPIQFSILVVEHADEPIFVPDTPPDQQLYEIYVGATFSIEVFAEPYINRTLDKFYFTRRDGELLNVSSITDRPDKGLNVRSQFVIWTPVMSDVGKHILCCRAEDSEGIATVNQRCFLMTVKEQIEKEERIDGLINFVNFPEKEDIHCHEQSKCRFPIYATSSNPGGIVNITIKSSSAEGTEIIVPLSDGKLSTFPKAKKIEIQFQDSLFGEKDICFEASDAHLSVTRCLSAVVQADDPCMTQPCATGICVVRGIGGEYTCICPKWHIGTHCETKISKCTENPCLQNATCQDYGDAVCSCPPGYTGRICETIIDECNQNATACENGVCDISPFSCQCFEGFSGPECRNKMSSCSAGNCASQGGCPQSCDSDFGQCKTHSPCVCAFGYGGSSCSQEITDLAHHLTSGGSGTDPKIVPPSPASQGQIYCDCTEQASEKCVFTVFVTEDKTGSINIPVLKNSKEYDKLNIHIANPSRLRTTNVYTFDVHVKRIKHEPEDYQICLQVMRRSDSTVSDGRCIPVKFIYKPHTTRELPEVHFIAPTIPTSSVLPCEIGRDIHVFLHTNLRPSSPTCEQPTLAKTQYAFIYPVSLSSDGSHCVADMIVDGSRVPSEQNVTLYLRASNESNSQAIKYIIQFKTVVRDPCENANCQNGGLCSVEDDQAHCHCLDGFFGKLCETGPCAPSMSGFCHNGGACYNDNSTKYCVCALGFEGTNCENVYTAANNKIDGSVIPVVPICYVDSPCYIPATFASPNMSLGVKIGYKDPDVSVLGISTKKENATSSFFTSVITMQSSKIGENTICYHVQDKSSTDEKCIHVNILGEKPPVVSTFKAYFVNPTPANGTALECKIDQACFLRLYANNRNGLSTCPFIISDKNILDGVHIFENAFSGNFPCIFDVRFQSSTAYTMNICLSVSSPVSGQDDVGGIGEERCYEVTVSHSPQSESSCTITQCENGGFCDGHTPEALCTCKQTFSGDHCQNIQGESVTDPSVPSTFPDNTTNTFGDIAIPSKIICELGQPCIFPFSVNAIPGQVPIVATGHVDTELSVKPPVLTHEVNNGSVFNAQVEINSNHTGTHQLCVQVKTQETVTDEICPEVEIVAPGGKEVNQFQPHFTFPTFPNNTELRCNQSRTCHLIMHVNGGQHGHCPNVNQVSGALDGVHIFQMETTSVNCTVDIALQPKTSVTGPQEYCFHAFLPSIPGEVRCTSIDFSPTGPTACVGRTCKHGGVCDSGICNCTSGHTGLECDGLCTSSSCLNNALCDGSGNSPVCYCRAGSSGNQCEQSHGASLTTTLQSHNQSHAFGDLAIPLNIKCRLNTECILPFYVNNQNNQRPEIAPGFMGTILTSPHVEMVQDIHQGSVTIAHLHVVGNETGTSRACIQVKSVNETVTDEICTTITITADPGYTDLAKPHFTSPSYENNSVVICPGDDTCHILLQTVKNPDGTCPVVGETRNSSEIVIINDDYASQNCSVDVLINNSTTTEETYCFQAKYMSDNGEERCVVVKHFSFISSPCINKQCFNGGVCIGGTCNCPEGVNGTNCETGLCQSKVCENGGTCVSGSCVCKSGFSGTKCENEASTSCSPGDCKNSGKCFSGECKCQPGFTGTFCENTTTIDTTDACYNITCKHGVCDGGLCVCVASYTGSLCQNEVNSSCNGVHCVNGGYCSSGKCICPGNFGGSQCQIETNGSCNGITCQNGGKCIDGSCVCSDQYGGSLCQIDYTQTTDQCKNVICQNAGVCRYGKCVCMPGFFGSNCQFTTVSNNSACSNINCGPHGKCENGFCVCDDGYSGGFCQLDSRTPCSNVICQHGGHCTNGACICPPRFSGKHCQIEAVASCANINCHNGTCNGGFCDCFPTFSGSNCQIEATTNPLDPCAGVICLNLGHCQNGICKCQQGFSGSLCQTALVNKPENCHSVTCGAHGVCVSGFCRCDSGWTGPSCQKKTDSTACDNVSCQNGGVCFAGKCRCVHGFTGSACQIANPSPCDGVYCSNGGSCENGYCICAPGYSGPNCQTQIDQTIDLCAGVSCSHGHCVDGLCHCSPGFGGATCDNVLDISNACVQVTCLNSGLCQKGDCQCSHGYSGSACTNEITSTCVGVECQNGGNCTDGVCQCPDEFSGSLCQKETVCGEEIDVKEFKRGVADGRVDCHCNVNGKVYHVIKSNPKVGKWQLFKTAGIGAGSVTAVIGVVSVIYMMSKKISSVSQNKSLKIKNMR